MRLSYGPNAGTLSALCACSTRSNDLNVNGGNDFGTGNASRNASNGKSSATREMPELWRTCLYTACQWLHFGFVGYLPVAQLLRLWDIIVATDTLIPLVRLAVLLVEARARRLRQCRSVKVVKVKVDLSFSIT